MSKDVQITKSSLISGDALEPSDTDIIAQIGLLDVGKPLPKGWNVITGNSMWSEIGRVAMRMQIESEA